MHCFCSWMQTCNITAAVLTPLREAFPSQPQNLKGGEAQRDQQNKAMVSAANAVGICRPYSVPVT